MDANGSGMVAFLEVSKALIQARQNCTNINSVILAAIDGVRILTFLF